MASFASTLPTANFDKKTLGVHVFDLNSHPATSNKREIEVTDCLPWLVGAGTTGSSPLLFTSDLPLKKFRESAWCPVPEVQENTSPERRYIAGGAIKDRGLGLPSFDEPYSVSIYEEHKATAVLHYSQGDPSLTVSASRQPDVSTIVVGEAPKKSVRGRKTALSSSVGGRRLSQDKSERADNVEEKPSTKMSDKIDDLSPHEPADTYEVLAQAAASNAMEMEGSQHTEAGNSFNDPFGDDSLDAPTHEGEDRMVSDSQREVNGFGSEGNAPPPAISANAPGFSTLGNMSSQFPQQLAALNRTTMLEGENQALLQYNAFLQHRIHAMESALSDVKNRDDVVLPVGSIARARQQQNSSREHVTHFENIAQSGDSPSFQQSSILGADTSPSGNRQHQRSSNQHQDVAFPSRGGSLNPFLHLPSASFDGRGSFAGGISQRRTAGALSSLGLNMTARTSFLTTPSSSWPLSSHLHNSNFHAMLPGYKGHIDDNAHRAASVAMLQRQQQQFQGTSHGDKKALLETPICNDAERRPPLWNPLPVAHAGINKNFEQQQRLLSSEPERDEAGLSLLHNSGKLLQALKADEEPSFPMSPMENIQLPQRPRLPPCENAGDNSMALASTSSVLPYHQRTDSIVPLAIDEDPNWLTEFLCFVRSDMVEVVRATESDVETRMATTKHIALGQVGIRCRFCAHLPQRAVRSSCFPSTIRGIYQSVTMMIREHFSRHDGSCGCAAMPPAIQQKYLLLKSRTTQGATDSKRYWVEAAKKIGMVETGDKGITISEATIGDAVRAEHLRIQKYWSITPSLPIDDSEDRKLLQKHASSGYVFFLLSQVEMVTLTEEECLGNRRSMQPGWPGFGCRYCCALARMGTCRFFPVKRRGLVTKLTIDLPNHLRKCTACPRNVKDDMARHRSRLGEKDLNLSEMDRVDDDFQECFDRIWNRLHSVRPNKRKYES